MKIEKYLKSNEIVLDEVVSDNNWTTLFFIAPAELSRNETGNNYPESIATEIAMQFECSLNELDPSVADVRISPTKEIEDGTEDYDWSEVYLSYDEIAKLIELAGGVINV